MQKVVEQHAGTLTLEDAPQSPTRTRGALVRMTLPVKTELAHEVSTDQVDLRCACSGLSMIDILEAQESCDVR